MPNCGLKPINLRTFIRINFNYSEGDIGKFIPIVRNIYISNVTSKKSIYALYFAGYERSPISDIFIQDCNFMNVKEGNILTNYTNLTMKNVTVNGKYQ